MILNNIYTVGFIHASRYGYERLIGKTVVVCKLEIGYASVRLANKRDFLLLANSREWNVIEEDLLPVDFTGNKYAYILLDDNV